MCTPEAAHGGFLPSAGRIGPRYQAVSADFFTAEAKSG
jgi:hypothetical protein